MNKVISVRIFASVAIFAIFACISDQAAAQRSGEPEYRQAKSAYFGAGLGYNKEIEAPSIRFHGGFPAGGEFFSFFVDGGVYMRNAPKAGDINANIRFHLPIGGMFIPYVYTGYNYTRYGRDYAGANFGIGAHTATTGKKFFFFTRAQFTWGQLNMISVNSGFSYVFSTVVR
jgi:hypothetical protein